jgi:hypothetical protein
MMTLIDHNAKNYDFDEAKFDIAKITKEHYIYWSNDKILYNLLKVAKKQPKAHFGLLVSKVVELNYILF